jgi:hypothetical protein
MSLEPIPALYTLLHSGEQEQIAQSIEIIHALQLSRDELTGMVERLFRANHTARKIAGMSVLGSFHERLPDRLLVDARQLIQPRLCSGSKPTIRRGLALLSALNIPDVTVELWQHMVDHPTRQATWMRKDTIEKLSMMVPRHATLPHTHLSHHALFGSRIPAKLPAVLTHMPNLEEISFKKCFNSFPSWISRVESIQRLNLGYVVSVPLHGSMLPSRLQTLALDRSPTPEVSLSIPTLQELTLHSCSSLSHLELRGCASLRSLDLSHCTALTALPDHLEALPALQTVTLSGCARLLSIPSALLRRSDVTILSDGCLSLKSNMSQQRSFSSLLSSKNIHDLHAAMQHWAALPPAERIQRQADMVAGLSTWLCSRSRAQVELAVETLDAVPNPGLVESLWGSSLMSPEMKLDGVLSEAHSMYHPLILRSLLQHLPRPIRTRLQHLNSAWLSDVDALHAFPSLRHLTLTKLPGELPDLSAFTHLTHLVIDHCSEVTRLPPPLPSLVHVTLRHLMNLADREGGQRLREHGVEILDRDHYILRIRR